MSMRLVESYAGGALLLTANGRVAASGVKNILRELYRRQTRLSDEDMARLETMAVVEALMPQAPEWQAPWSRGFMADSTAVNMGWDADV